MKTTAQEKRVVEKQPVFIIPFIVLDRNLSAGVNNPAASNGASSLQRCRAAGYVTLAAFAKWMLTHPLGSLLAGINGYGST